jgi:phage terminase large subunit-like protein
MYEYAVKCSYGVVDDDRFLPIIYELDEKAEWTNPDMWMKANPALGTIKEVDDIIEKVERAKVNPNDIAGVLTKDFNIRETPTGSWLTFDDINNTDTFTMDDIRNTYAIGGVDLSSVSDLTCATLVIMKPNSDKKYVLQQYFIPSEIVDMRTKEDKVPYDKWAERGLVTLSDGHKVNYSDVTNWFIKIYQEYDIRPLWVGYDPWNSQYWIDEMENSGFHMKVVRQGALSLSQPMKELATDIKSNFVNYNNNPILKWCLMNTSVKKDDNGNIRPIKGRNERQRIDGAVSLLIAYTILFQNLNDYKSLV